MASESWVEVASQPSSSSLSSIGDEIVTTGLRVGNAAYPPRRRRLQQLYQQHVQQTQPTYTVNQGAAHAGGSSQEEYDETESDDDRLMTSSTENMPTRPNAPSLARSQTAPGVQSAESESEDDDDENATALGKPTSSQGFRPQPNAFSHPPSHLSQRSYSTNSAIPPHMSPHSRPSLSQRANTRHGRTPDYRSPSYQADNDAALRASLTTLLSCAAAAKSLPKGREDAIAGPSRGPMMGAGIGPSSQPMELRLVPESELMAERPSPNPTSNPAVTATQPVRTASHSSAQSVPASTASSREEKSKRTASSGHSKSQRATKKKRTSASLDNDTPTFISPTLLTWVVSAGVVVLVSVVGFGAGYVIGREVGRQEAGLGLSMSSGATGAGVNATSCGREVIRSTGGGTLRRFRWGAGMGRSVTA